MPLRTYTIRKRDECAKNENLKVGESFQSLRARAHIRIYPYIHVYARTLLR